jgi:hypothetical protein
MRPDPGALNDDEIQRHRPLRDAVSISAGQETNASPDEMCRSDYREAALKRSWIV